MKYKLTKISDDKFDGEHPNGINEGYTTEGYEGWPLEVGESYCVGALRTSTVTEIVDENTFKTKNSTYRREPLEDGMPF